MEKKTAKPEASTLKDMKRAGKAAMDSEVASGTVVTLTVDN